MGNTCCNQANNDKHSKDYGKPQTKKKNDPAMNELLKTASKHEDKVVKIQAGWRGHQVRSHLKVQDDDKHKPRASGRISQRNRDGVTGGATAKPITNLPDYSNSATRATEAKMGGFTYDQIPQATDKDLIPRQPYELDNGAIYQGQWTKDGLRHGKGI